LFFLCGINVFTLISLLLSFISFLIGGLKIYTNHIEKTQKSVMKNQNFAGLCMNPRKSAPLAGKKFLPQITLIYAEKNPLRKVDGIQKAFSSLRSLRLTSVFFAFKLLPFDNRKWRGVLHCIVLKKVYRLKLIITQIYNYSSCCKYLLFSWVCLP